MSQTKILGHCYEPLRSLALQREFRRPSNRQAYNEAVSALQKAKGEKLDVEETKKTIRQQGMNATNSDNFAELNEGAMKLIAAADYVVRKHTENPDKTEKNFSEALNELFEAIKGYHYAANTLRRLQQFQLSADFYFISARIGDAVLRCMTNREFQGSSRAEGIVDLAIRSLLRSRAAYREQGSDHDAEKVYIFTLDLRRNLAFRKGQWHRWAALTTWKYASEYGTNLTRILIVFASWIVITSIIDMSVEHTPTAYSGTNISAFLMPLFDKIRTTLYISFGGSISSGAAGLMWYELFIKVTGIIWAALLVQLIVHRTAAR